MDDLQHWLSFDLLSQCSVHFIALFHNVERRVKVKG